MRPNVLKLWGGACAACGLELRATSAYECEVAHLRSVEDLGHDNTANALPLCRTHHWAFDKNLWGIHPRSLVIDVRKDFRKAPLGRIHAKRLRGPIWKKDATGILAAAGGNLRKARRTGRAKRDCQQATVPVEPQGCTTDLPALATIADPRFGEIASSSIAFWHRTPSRPTSMSPPFCCCSSAGPRRARSSSGFFQTGFARFGRAGQSRGQLREAAKHLCKKKRQRPGRLCSLVF